MKQHTETRTPIKSPQFSAIRGARLTDARILHYIRQGFYGRWRQEKQLKLDALNENKSKAKPRAKQVTCSVAEFI